MSILNVLKIIVWDSDCFWRLTRFSSSSFIMLIIINLHFVVLQGLRTGCIIVGIILFVIRCLLNSFSVIVRDRWRLCILGIKGILSTQLGKSLIITVVTIWVVLLLKTLTIKFLHMIIRVTIRVEGRFVINGTRGKIHVW